MVADTEYWIICKTDEAKRFFEDRANEGDVWSKLVLANIDGRRPFGCGDALVARDELQEAGFEWSKDFYLKKESSHDQT